MRKISLSGEVTRLSRVLLRIGLAATVLGVCWGQQSTQPPQRTTDLSRIGAQVHGTALDEAGKPIAGAKITLVRVADSGGPSATAGTQVSASRADGTFFFKNVGPGVWKACGTIENSQYLDPCEWSGPISFRAEQGKALMGLQVVLRKGQAVHVRVEDSGKRLKEKSNGQKDSEIELGVWAQKRFYRMRRLGEDSGGEYHMVVVPLQTPVQLSVKGKEIEFDLESDGKKSDIKGGSEAAQAVEFQSNEGPKNIKLITRAPKK